MHQSELSPARRELLDRMHALGFGRIERLMVLNGEPQFTPDTKIIEEHRFGVEAHTPRPSRRPDLPLRAQHLELFAALDRLGSGVVELIQVQNGLPYRMAAERAA